MRRLKVNNTSLASATVAAHQLPRTTQLQNRPSISLSPSLRLVRLLAVLTVIGFQFRCVLCTAATSASISTSLSTQSNSTENNFYFDEQNTTTKSQSILAADSTAAIADVSPMPAEALPTLPTARAQVGLTTLTTVRLMGSETSMRTAVDSDGIGNGTTVRNHNAVDLGSTGVATAAAATTKSIRSTIKQPNLDATRSRNHWTVGGSADAERSRTFRSKYHHENHYGPFFEEPSNLVDPGKTLVSAVHLFTEAVLNCRVGMLKDKTVMWVRRTTEKVSLLTVGNVTYSGDPRIRVKFQYPNNWRLMINPTQREDAGIYMCQVSTHPPRVFTTNLTILEPPLRIIDEHERDVGDRYYKSGSTVDLQCQISRNFFQKERHSILKSTGSSGSANKPNETGSDINLIADANQTYSTFSSQELEKYFTNFITWAKDEEPLPAPTNRRSSVSDKWLNSRISIPEAKLSDSGNYSCSLGRLFTVIVQVQVLTGELPAAVQHNLAHRSDSCFSLTWSLVLILICFYALASHSSHLHNITDER
ncbi:uncharacterized protein dpr18 isoform X1 [Drosophila virilis]|uniref:Uncharacterized protein, isoform C n=2 Tax=Drosophila virilis TaxID=7244 RepID=B4MGC0_DROVI|nr:uncharacterized protein LOC6636700 isoform X1 [Drosophila virilis]XP_032296122.1 uncharacterized protein LOC6636700 isoform X1 [Drosophila virilis]EDW57443.2 uncharacterized protein Dvir_GJ18492, isoform C [Drosophila virilis]